MGGRRRMQRLLRSGIDVVSGRHEVELEAPKRKPTRRKQTWEQLISLENGIRQVCYTGLQHWCLTDAFVASHAPLSWPSLALAGDEGSENIAGWHFIGRRLQGNVYFYNDPSHGGSRDLEAALRNAGAFLLQVLMCSAWNVGHGPWSDNARFVAVRNRMLGRLSDIGVDDAVFDELYDELVVDFNLDDLKGSPELRGMVIREVQDSKSWWNKGSKTTLQRFLDPLYRGEGELRLWHTRLYQYVTTALEMDQLDERSIRKCFQHRSAALKFDQSTSDGAGTSMKEDRARSHAMRETAGNQLRLACAFVADKENYLREVMVVSTGAPLLAWHTGQQIALRDVESSRHCSSSAMAATTST